MIVSRGRVVRHSIRGFFRSRIPFGTIESDSLQCVMAPETEPYVGLPERAYRRGQGRERRHSSAFRNTPGLSSGASLSGSHGSLFRQSLRTDIFHDPRDSGRLLVFVVLVQVAPGGAKSFSNSRPSLSKEPLDSQDVFCLK